MPHTVVQNLVVEETSWWFRWAHSVGLALGDLAAYFFRGNTSTWLVHVQLTPSGSLSQSWVRALSPVGPACSGLARWERPRNNERIAAAAQLGAFTRSGGPGSSASLLVPPAIGSIRRAVGNRNRMIPPPWKHGPEKNDLRTQLRKSSPYLT